MRTLLIHQAFVSPEEPGGTRHYELAQHLLKEGHEFSVVTSDLSYLTGQPVGPRHGLLAEENVNGIRVLRAYTYPSLHRNFVWRVVSFLSFMLTSVWAALRAGPVDVVMGTSPPIFQAASAWLVAVLRRRPFLLEIRDLWPAFAIDMGVLRNPTLIFLSRKLEDFLYARANQLVVNSPAYRDYLIERGVPDRKINLIPNGVDPNMFDPTSDGSRVRHEWLLDEKFIVTYTGALGAANDIPTLLRAARRLLENPAIHFLLVGDGQKRSSLEALARELRLFNVTFTGTRPKTEMPEILAASNVCVAILRNIPMFRTTYPNKVFDYMAAGRPTVLAIDGVIREVMVASGGGLCVPPGDDAALADAIKHLSKEPEKVRHMGSMARSYVVEHFDRTTQAHQFSHLLEVVTSTVPQGGFYRRFGKRCLDMVLSVPGIVLMSPLLLLVAIWVRIKLGSPVLFQQDRPGVQGEPFTIYKFRTMREMHDASGTPLADGARLTPFGRFLRNNSLDEFPELFNVLKGDMSLVGPRPLLMQYLDRYTTEQMRRHEAKPGITGWAQVCGRNTLTWEEKFALDVWYVEHVSLWLDLKILALTIWKTLRREGINQAGEATAKEFMGRGS